MPEGEEKNVSKQQDKIDLDLLIMYGFILQIYAFEAKDIRGQTKSLQEYSGKVSLTYEA